MSGMRMRKDYRRANVTPRTARLTLAALLLGIYSTLSVARRAAQRLGADDQASFVPESRRPLRTSLSPRRDHGFVMVKGEPAPDEFSQR